MQAETIDRMRRPGRMARTHGHARQSNLADRLRSFGQAVLGTNALIRSIVGLALGAGAYFVLGVGAAVATAFTVVAAPRVIRDVSSSRRRRALEAQLANTCDLLARRLSTGASLRLAFADVSRQLPDPVRTEIERVNDLIDVGVSPEDAFAEIAAASGSEIYALTAHSIHLHARSGGNIVATLRRVARIARERRAADLEVAALTAQGRYSGVVVACMPVALSFFTSGFDSSSVPVWIRITIEAVGWLLVAAGLVLIWRMTSPDAAMVKIRKRSPARSSTGRLRAVLRGAGARMPEPVAGRQRTEKLLVSGSRSVDQSLNLDELAALRVVTAALFAVVAVRLLGIPTGLLAIVPAAVCGWFVAEFPVRRMVQAERAAIETRVPDLCDLLVLALGAGKNLHQAIIEAAGLVDGPLGGELGRVRELLDLGEPLDDALFALASRTNCDDVAEVVSAIEDARRRGGALAESLDELARDMRARERMRTQARARKLPVKILFPLTFLVLPAFVLLTVAPLIMSAISELSF